MRYKQLIIRKLADLRNQIIGQDSSISMLRPPEELKLQLEIMISKIHEIEVLLNGEEDQ